MERVYRSTLGWKDYLVNSIFLVIACLVIGIYIPNMGNPRAIAILVLPVVFIIAILGGTIPKWMQKLIINNGTLYLYYFGRQKWNVDISNIKIIDDTQNHGYRKRFIGSRGGRVIGFTLLSQTDGEYMVPNAIDNYQDFIKDLQVINPNIQVGKVTETLNEKWRDYLRSKKII